MSGDTLIRLQLDGKHGVKLNQRREIGSERLPNFETWIVAREFDSHWLDYPRSTPGTAVWITSGLISEVSPFMIGAMPLRNVRRIFGRSAWAFLFLVIGTSALYADSIVVVPGGNLVANVIEAAQTQTFLALDVEGTDLLGVLDDGGNLIGAAAGGSLSPTFPNETLFAYSFDGTQFVSLAIDDFFISGNDLITDITGTPLTPITDPGLQDFVGNLQFSFAYESTTVDPTGAFSFSAFALTNIHQTPEPGTRLLCFLAGIALLLFAVTKGTGKGSTYLAGRLAESASNT